MNITIWGINYAPEVTGIAPYNKALCEYLQSKGHSARMVTGFAYYPAWKKEKPDKRKLFRTEQMDGVTVHRCWQYVPKRPSAVTRILHELSFVVMSFLRLLFLPRPDVLVVISPPLLIGAAAWVLGGIKRTPFWFHVQDLQPDAAYALGLLKRGWLARVLYWLEAFAYRKADKVSGISQGMLEAFARKGVPASKVVYFPNGVTMPVEETLPRFGEFRKRHGVPEDAFVAAYSGNLGVKQGLNVLVEAARHLGESNVRIFISGDGARRESLSVLVRELGLANVTMLPLQPEKEFYEMLVDTDLAVITQESGTGQYFFPSKLLRTLAFGKPVLTVADPSSELSKALVSGRFGVNVEPNQPDRLASALVSLAERKHLRDMGDAGRTFVKQFEFAKVLMDFESVLRTLDRVNGPELPAVAAEA